jgi:hypothetical protein
LKQTMGLDAASIGSAAVERAVQERLSACRLADAQTHHAAAASSNNSARSDAGSKRCTSMRWISPRASTASGWPSLLKPPPA